MLKNEIVILHGWGLRGQNYKELASLLENDGYKVYLLDLPGFGSEPLVNNSMILDDYVIFFRTFIKKNKITKPIIIGHSFGGRVAIKYLWRYKNAAKALVLTGVPIIRHVTIKRKIAYFVAVLGGFVFKIFPKETKIFMRKVLYSFIGEWDYYKAGPLQQVFKNIIGEELTSYVKDISIPVLLVWGEKDMVVLAADVLQIKKFMPHAKAVIVAGEDHKLPYVSPKKFIKAIKSVL